MKIDAKTIKREVAALRRHNKKPPFYLMIGTSTDLEGTKRAVVESGEMILVIQDEKTPNLFMLVDEAGFNYIADK